MLFEGLSRKHASHFLEEKNQESLLSYYTKYRSQICNTLYKDAYYGFRFWTLLMDHMRRVHTTLPLIMRSQYKGCDELYIFVKSFENRNDVKSLCESLLRCKEEWCRSLFDDVCSFIIFPLLKKYSVYSPTLLLFMFFDSISAMIEVYVEKGFDVKFRCFAKGYLNQNSSMFIKPSVWLTNVHNEMLVDECNVFAKMRESHRRVK